MQILKCYFFFFFFLEVKGKSKWVSVYTASPKWWMITLSNCMLVFFYFTDLYQHFSCRQTLSYLSITAAAVIAASSIFFWRRFLSSFLPFFFYFYYTICIIIIIIVIIVFWSFSNIQVFFSAKIYNEKAVKQLMNT